MKKGSVVLLVLLLFGAVRLPMEHRLAAEHRAAYFHGAKLDLALRQQVGQLGFLAALSGFRALVADLMWIRAHTAWEKLEWGRMAWLFNGVTALQPRATMFWDMAGWHMAWNASIAAMEDPKLPRQAQKLKAQREYFDLGRDFLQRGIQNNPDRYVLYERLGTLYRDKYLDHCAAADQFATAATFPDAPSYLKRFAVYEMAECPERQREAYDRLVELYQMGEKERLPTLLKQLQTLAEKLHVPPEARVYNPPR